MRHEPSRRLQSLSSPPENHSESDPQKVSKIPLRTISFFDLAGLHLLQHSSEQFFRIPLAHQSHAIFAPHLQSLKRSPVSLCVWKHDGHAMKSMTKKACLQDRAPGGMWSSHQTLPQMEHAIANGSPLSSILHPKDSLQSVLPHPSSAHGSRPLSHNSGACSRAYTLPHSQLALRSSMYLEGLSSSW